MQLIEVLPNFTILAQVNQPDYFTIRGYLRSFCIQEKNLESVDTYKMTASAFWDGINKNLDKKERELQKLVDILNLSNNLPSNVIKELKNWTTRFGVVSLVGDDCIQIKNQNILKEVLNNSKLKPHVYEVDGNLVYVQGINFLELKDIFENEIGYPIVLRRSKIQTYLLKINSKRISVKAGSIQDAFKIYFNYNKKSLEEDLRQRLRIRKDLITNQDIEQYFGLLEDEGNLVYDRVTFYSSYQPMTLGLE